MVEFKHTDYTTAKGVLVFPDHYVSVAHTFKKDDAAAVTEDGRKIVKAGTLYPSNDASAIGIVWADYDVTDGDRTGALIIHGFVKTKALPVIPSSALQVEQSVGAVRTKLDALNLDLGGVLTGDSPVAESSGSVTEVNTHDIDTNLVQSTCRLDCRIL